ncbi:aspartate carbamoyltransferase [Halalkalibacillus sediminis]|uniref:Aspartate carbamoyltransferase n=1 Tax=Halalkalibacillus sediminis TaxID=2018042 RepID=A0A2I0QW61_9BACI|nr:aspartate carbamoyltransferase catalytic subunit [Halalkalibacillus sediminis]PKR78558.1 aspartate carbamoyltransferase [Halalkalibacillus sediminis]
MNHLLTMNDVSTDEINKLLDRAEEFQRNPSIDTLEEKSAALLFFEPSTRTKMSFEMACDKLQMKRLTFSPEQSSVTKGESLYDTIKTLESIGSDVIIVRHPEKNYFNAIKNLIDVPMINAGDGSGEHPTQSLLDLMTIRQEFNRFEHLNVAICGDIKHSRVARSNAIALDNLGANVTLVAKEEWQDHSLPFKYHTIDEAISGVDVLMLLRVQYERHEIKEGKEESYLQTYGLTKERERAMRKGSIIMHPAPVNRGIEIDSELVECERSRIFQQMTNGVAVREAIIEHCLK